MNKKETILEIQRQLKHRKGYPVVDYLNKLNETEVFWLMMDIIMVKNELKEAGKELVK